MDAELSPNATPDLVTWFAEQRDRAIVVLAHDHLLDHGYPDADLAAVAGLWRTCPIRSVLGRRKTHAWQWLVNEYVSHPEKR